jgi:hypothetical protein
MTALSIIQASLQEISSWLMSLLAVIVLFVSVLAAFVAVEFACGVVARAYTVKTASCDEHGVSATSARPS